uniref:Protein EFR3 homolog B-like n=1 Tax=Hirondellea gigas TaxID=1518452 RepID=A0A6A7FW16_9CRUS
MDKLVWYAMNSPDKLDRIGEYLAHRLFRDISRRRHGYACVSMDALDQLLVTCHANSLNLFVENFLQMVQKLLECTEPALQLRATHSFEKFANIREDTPSYHRRYDFLVSKFSSLCYSAHLDPPTRRELRTAGIRGLQGVVRKTDWNDLGENIWRPGHMEKIVPSLLFNIQDAPALQSAGKKGSTMSGAQNGGTEGEKNGGGKSPEGQEATDGGGEGGNDTKSPPELAESCLRELVARVTFSRIGSVVRPLLSHMDQHKLWSNELMAVHIFKIVMYSIQSQYSINVVDLLMSHLSEHRTNASRCGIATVLGQIIPIAAGECVGPSVIEMINSLLEQVRLSMSESVSDLAVGGSGVGGMVSVEEQQQYQDRLIHALAEYIHHLPDFHKIECMLFILTKVPGSERVEEAGSVRPAAESRLQHLLLNCLLKVATRYHSSQYYITFSTALLARLLRLSVSGDAVVRRLILMTLSALLPTSPLQLPPTLSIDSVSLLLPPNTPPSRQDINFWKKCGSEILASVQDSCELQNNAASNYTATYSLLGQLLIEVRADDVSVDVIRTMLNMQEWCSGAVVEMATRVHALIAAVMVVAAAVVPQLNTHVSTVVSRRERDAAWLLPKGEEEPMIPSTNFVPAPHLLFNRQEIISLLQPTNLNEQRVMAGTSSSSVLRRASSTATSTIHHYSVVVGDTLQEEEDSAASSPAVPRREVLCGVEAVPFEAIKSAAAGTDLATNVAMEAFRQEEEKRHQMTYALLHDSYDALLARQQPDPLQAKLNDLLSRLPISSNTNSGIPSMTVATSASTCNPIGLKPLTLLLPYPDIVIC